VQRNADLKFLVNNFRFSQKRQLHFTFLPESRFSLQAILLSQKKPYWVFDDSERITSLTGL